MDARNRSLDELVEQYMASPGSSESEQLEFKAKEKVESTKGKKKIAEIAAAFANTSGGTIIIGVGEGNRDDIIQSFDSRSEIIRDLANVFRDNTKLPLTHQTTIEMDTLSNGPRLLRIDIAPENTYPIEVKDRKEDEYVPYHRVEDTTRVMETVDVVEFTKRRIPEASNDEIGLRARVSINDSDMHVFEESDPRKSPANRAIQNSSQLGLIIPSRFHLDNPFKKSLTYHVEKHADQGGIEGLKGMLKEAEEVFNADLGFDFGYAVGYNEKQLIGRNASNFVDDLENLDQTLKLLGGENDSDPRPVAIGGTHCNHGFVWFQAQYHTGSLARIKCGLMLTDIPINDQAAQQVFGDSWYEQDDSTRVVQFRIKGKEVPLTSTREVLLDDSGHPAHTEIIADNPLYQNKESIIESMESEIPEQYINAISSVDRLAFDVRGGYSEEDIYHSVGEIEVGHIRAVVPAYFVWPLCNPHTEPPSESSSSADALHPIKIGEGDEDCKK